MFSRARTLLFQAGNFVKENKHELAMGTLYGTAASLALINQQLVFENKAKEFENKINDRKERKKLGS